MDILIIVGIVALCIAPLVLAAYFFPTILTKWRASALGLNLTFYQAKIITKDYCNKKDFLLNVKEIWFWDDIPIERLTNPKTFNNQYINTQELLRKERIYQKPNVK